MSNFTSGSTKDITLVLLGMWGFCCWNYLGRLKCFVWDGNRKISWDFYVKEMLGNGKIGDRNSVISRFHSFIDLTLFLPSEWMSESSRDGNSLKLFGQIDKMLTSFHPSRLPIASLWKLSPTRHQLLSNFHKTFDVCKHKKNFIYLHKNY